MLFAAIGMVISPWFVLTRLGMILTVLTLIIAVKMGMFFIIARAHRFSRMESARVACALGNVAEYSLLVTGKAHQVGLLSRQTYLIWMSATVFSVVLSPGIMHVATLYFPEAHRPFHRGHGATAEEMDEDASDSDDHQPLAAHATKRPNERTGRRSTLSEGAKITTHVHHGMDSAVLSCRPGRQGVGGAAGQVALMEDNRGRTGSNMSADSTSRTVDIPVEVFGSTAAEAHRNLPRSMRPHQSSEQLDVKMLARS